MTGAGQAEPKRENRKVWPLRVAPSGIDAFAKAARRQGYDHTTTWARDVLAAEAMNPKHRPKPKKEK